MVVVVVVVVVVVGVARLPRARQRQSEQVAVVPVQCGASQPMLLHCRLADKGDGEVVTEREHVRVRWAERGVAA